MPTHTHHRMLFALGKTHIIPIGSRAPSPFFLTTAVSITTLFLDILFGLGTITRGPDKLPKFADRHFFSTHFKTIDTDTVLALIVITIFFPVGTAHLEAVAWNFYHGGAITLNRR